MKTTPLFSAALATLGLLLATGAAPAPNAGTVGDAFQVARQAVKPELQSKVVSVYGTGSTTAIDKWYIIFYDPAAFSHGRAVLVENGKITKSYVANGGVTYSKDLAFDPSRITSEGPALAAAQDYAAKHKITFDAVHTLLKPSALNKPFRWRVELLHNGHSRGFVYVSALDDQVSAYEKPSARTSAPSSNTDDFGDEVKSTFLGIGGDLQEFFTGERTVDK